MTYQSSHVLFYFFKDKSTEKDEELVEVESKKQCLELQLEKKCEEYVSLYEEHKIISERLQSRLLDVMDQLNHTDQELQKYKERDSVCVLYIYDHFIRC